MTTTVRPNIRPATPPHSECWRQDHNERGRVGDVRRCRHGAVQVRSKTTSRTMAGPGTDWWRDLRPFLDRKEYRAAVAALDATETQ